MRAMISLKSIYIYILILPTFLILQGCEKPKTEFIYPEKKTYTVTGKLLNGLTGNPYKEGETVIMYNLSTLDGYDDGNRNRFGSASAIYKNVNEPLKTDAAGSFSITFASHSLGSYDFEFSIYIKGSNQPVANYSSGRYSFCNFLESEIGKPANVYVYKQKHQILANVTLNDTAVVKNEYAAFAFSISYATDLDKKNNDLHERFAMGFIDPKIVAVDLKKHMRFTFSNRISLTKTPYPKGFQLLNADLGMRVNKAQFLNKNPFEKTFALPIDFNKTAKDTVRLEWNME